MIITKNDLEEIETHVGHNCTAGVLAGENPGDIAIRVWAEEPITGNLLNFQQEFTPKDFIDDLWKQKLDYLKHEVKGIFDVQLAS